MVNKVKNCYGCPAHIESKCLLGYKRNISNCNVKGPKGVGHIVIYSPKECCYKPRTQKEFFQRWKGMNNG